MKRIRLAFFSFIFLSCIATMGCGISEQTRDMQPTYREYLSKAGIIGKHELKHPSKHMGIQGSLAGNLFLGFGSVAGNMQSQNKVLFSWSPVSGSVVSSEYPVTMFRIITDNNSKQPIVEFVFDNEWLSTKAIWDERTILNSENANSIIDFGKAHLLVIKIYISEADLRKEPALPQI